MDIRKLRTCERCRASVPLDEVRLFPKEKDKNILVCGKCSQELSKPKAQLKSKAPAPPQADYTSYFCDRCKYSFRVDSSKAGLTYVLHCPYCGKSDRLHEKA